VQIKIYTKDSSLLPSYKTAGAAGMDVMAASDGELAPGARALVPTGLFMEIPEGYEGQMRPRSGLALKHGITMLNSPGTIDSDYRGEVGLILYNASDELFRYKKGDRLGQIVFAKVEQAEVVQVESLSDTERGSGGFGSTHI
jgi:dUTP pyrophosphatase